jgi:sugar phosphate isomerase/epimerase
VPAVRRPALDGYNGGHPAREDPALDYGISTAAYQTLPLAAALARIARLSRLAELRSEGFHDLTQPANLRAALAARRDGLRFTVHGPFSHQIIWSRDDARRRRGLDDHRRHLDVAAQLGASVYVVHPDYTHEPRPFDAQLVDRLRSSFAELFPLQHELGLRIAVENMPGVGRSHFATPGLDTCGLPLAIDVGHAHLSDALVELIMLPDIIHWHLHDNPGLGGDPHGTVGGGSIDWAPVVKRIGETAVDGATAVLEVTSEEAVIASLAFLARVERDLSAGDA